MGRLNNMSEIEEKIKYDPIKVLIVPIDQVRPNTWNPKDENTEDFKKVLFSVEHNGLKLPIVVRENNGYEIIDGEQRWRAAKQLGFKMVLIYNEGVIDDLRAKELTINYQQQVPFNQVDLAHLVSEIADKVSLPYSKEEIDNFITMSKFNIDDFKETPVPEVGADLLKSLMVQMTNEQYEIVMQAMTKVKATAEGDLMSDGRAIELICADYLAGK